MGKHESKGKSDEWYTPKYIFDALQVEFDLDVAHPVFKTSVPAKEHMSFNSLEKEWKGFVWMNPPFGNQKEKFLWINKFLEHGNGIALLPDRTSAKWWQRFSRNCDAILFVDGKIKFIDCFGKEGENPSNGTTLFAKGEKAVQALLNAEKNNLGIFFKCTH